MKALYNSLYGLFAGTIIPQVASFSTPVLKRALSAEGSFLKRSQSSIADYTSSLFYKNEMEDESIKAEDISDNIDKTSLDKNAKEPSKQKKSNNVKISQIQKELQEISIDEKKAKAVFTKKEAPTGFSINKSNTGKRKSQHIEPITIRDVFSSGSEKSSKRKGSHKSPSLVSSDEDTVSQKSTSTKKSHSSKKRASKNSRSRSSSWGTDEDSLASVDETKISAKEQLAKLKGQRLIIQNFNRNSDAVSAVFDTSSDSEDALEPFEETRGYSQIKRREAHRQDLIAIAKQAFPPDNEMRQLYQQTMLSR